MLQLVGKELLWAKYEYDVCSDIVWWAAHLCRCWPPVYSRPAMAVTPAVRRSVVVFAGALLAPCCC